MKSSDAFKEKDEWVICGDIYVKDKFFTYRQIPISKIKTIQKESDTTFLLFVRNYESFEDTESLNSVSGKDKEKHAQKLKKIQNISEILLDLNQLDSYFKKNKKNKDLKDKHIGGFMKLFESKNK